MKYPKVEYMRVSGNKIMPEKCIIIAELDRYGEQGWELVTFTWVGEKLAFAYFKRVTYAPMYIINTKNPADEM